MNHNKKSYLEHCGVSAWLSVELEEHFILDIENQMTQGATFQEAFTTTAHRWKEDFKRTRISWYLFYKVPKIEVESVRGRLQNGLMYSTAIGVCSIIFQWAFPGLNLWLFLFGAFGLSLFCGYALISKKK